MGWEFWIDRGGTFTDVVARDPDGRLHTHKLLSQDPERYADAAVEAVGRLAGPHARIDTVRMGTTLATNALLERRGEPTVLVTTRGFADALAIGYQDRPHLFARHIVRPGVLHSQVIEADERLAADGSVLRPLDEAALAEQLGAARAAGLRSVAIAFLHSYREPRHELAAAAIARDLGFEQVSVSAEVSPLMKFVARADTTVVDAYLSPVINRYVQQVQQRLPRAELLFMTSGGGLVPAGSFRGKDAILSGPAGGVVGMARVAEGAGFDRAIGFDMGGTSTDVSHYAGHLERQFETVVAGARLRSPMMSIHTVAAGGGSILSFDGSRYRVGPDSAGADPGPASYRRGGPLTVTDANVMLGRIQPEHFPHVFGDGSQSLDAKAVREQFTELAQEIDDGRSPEQVAAGFRQIAVANMANAITRISVQRGYDVTGYPLVTFGGAGGQHACAVAEVLGMSQVLIHPLAGVLSAYGMGMADVSSIRSQAVEQPLTQETTEHLGQVVADLQAEARTDLDADPDRTDVQVHLRYAGTDTALQVPLDSPAQMMAAFESAYRQRFSFLMPDKQILLEAVTVELTLRADTEDLTPARAVDAAGAETGGEQVPMFTGGRWAQVPLVQRSALVAGRKVSGPAIIAETTSTTVVEPGWSAQVRPDGNLLLTAHEGSAVEHVSTERDPMRLEIFNNLFMSVAEQMGVRLQGTAHSVNIKERLDFSCALFDAEGNLIANAPHIPVHLGSMGETIRIVAERNAGRMRPGDAYAVNDPFHGGTHLPDVTVVTPVFLEGSLEFFVASRGHHAEIGGATPGSMPAFSTHLGEEGVVIDNWLLAREGHLREAETIELLASARYPSRNPEHNLADLRAQIAANERGVAELRAMVADYGLDVVQAYMRHVRANAAEAVARVIPTLTGGTWRQEMDGGGVIQVAVQIDDAARRATIDFSGTSAQLSSNFNAPSAVVTAAVLYVFRTLVDDEIPLNAGCLEPLDVIIPAGSMLAPDYPAAVVAGNVETSQAVTAALYGALGAQAEGAGTMNNVTFGNDTHQYYETVASGSGAGPGFDGADVVQTHMTNSRLTDPEILEWRMPVRLQSFSIRRGSGGAGTQRGGDGARRVLQFTAPVTLTLLSGNRRHAPYGLAGGSPGAVGEQWVQRADGTHTRLAGCDSIAVAAGDALVLLTPGGGGYGPPQDSVQPQ